MLTFDIKGRIFLLVLMANFWRMSSDIIVCFIFGREINSEKVSVAHHVFIDRKSLWLAKKHFCFFCIRQKKIDYSCMLVSSKRETFVQVKQSVLHDYFPSPCLPARQ